VQHYARAGGEIQRLLIVDDRESVGHESHGVSFLLGPRSPISTNSRDPESSIRARRVPSTR
jgi:hypothetical protein